MVFNIPACLGMGASQPRNPYRGFFRTSDFFIVFYLSYIFFGVSVGLAGGVNKSENTAVKILNGDMSEQLLHYVRN
jgi:hypothetical protein